MTSDSDVRPPSKIEIQQLRPSDGIRWAVGSPTTARGATWRFWANKKGDYYLAVRTLGGILKTSLHRDRRCHTGLTTEYAAKLSPATSRHMDKWELPDLPIVKALQVVTPQAELEPFPSAEANPMKWIVAPPSGFVSVVTVFILQPPYDAEEPWPGANQGAEPLGVAATTLRTAFLVHSQNPLDQTTMAEIETYRTRMKTDAGASVPRKDGLRAILFGNDPTGGRFFIDLAYK